MRSFLKEFPISAINQLTVGYVMLFWLCVIVVKGGVEIIKPYHPLYVKAGSALKIVCESKDRTKLEWIQSTPKTGWMDRPVVPLLGSNIVIQSFLEEPSGFTKSTLIKLNMSLSDRGTYICKDSSSNYAVWVTVLLIKPSDTTSLSSKSNPLVLGCSISGFDSNVPTIDYDWMFEDAYVAHTHYEMAAPVFHSPVRQSSAGKYKIKMENNDLWLEIYNPSSLDGGSYNCVFTLSTNLGPVMFSGSMHVNGSLLTYRSTGVEHSATLHVPLLTFLIVMAISFIK